MAALGNLDLDGLGDGFQAEVRAGTLLDLVLPQLRHIGLLDAMDLNVLDDLLASLASGAAYGQRTNGETESLTIVIFYVLGLLFAAGSTAFLAAMLQLLVLLLFLLLFAVVSWTDDVGVNHFGSVACSLFSASLTFLGGSLGGSVQDGVGGSKFVRVAEHAVPWCQEISVLFTIEGTAKTTDFTAELFGFGGGQLDTFTIIDHVEVTVDFNFHLTVGQSVDLDQIIFNIVALFVVELNWLLVDENLSGWMGSRVGAAAGWDHIDFKVVLLVVDCDLDILLFVAGVTNKDGIIEIILAVETG